MPGWASCTVLGRGPLENPAVYCSGKTHDCDLFKSTHLLHCTAHRSNTNKPHRTMTMTLPWGGWLSASLIDKSFTSQGDWLPKIQLRMTQHLLYQYVYSISRSRTPCSTVINEYEMSKALSKETTAVYFVFALIGFPFPAVIHQLMLVKRLLVTSKSLLVMGSFH